MDANLWALKEYEEQQYKEFLDFMYNNRGNVSMAYDFDIEEEIFLDSERIGRGVGMATIRKPRATKVAGSAVEVVKEQKRVAKMDSEIEKELVMFKKTYAKQESYLKDLAIEIGQLHNILVDSFRRLNADCVDDVYSIEHAAKLMAAASKKLQAYTKVSVESL